MHTNVSQFLFAAILATSVIPATAVFGADGPPRTVELLNASYDPTRELWKASTANSKKNMSARPAFA